MIYDAKIIGVETHSDNVLYKLRIINSQTFEQRDIRVKYSFLSDLHQQLQDLNPDYQLPQFPKKEFFQSIFRENKFIKQSEQMIAEYISQLIKSPPPLYKLLYEFLRDGADAIRQKELSKEITSRSELLKLIKTEKVLKKSLFGKTKLCTFQGIKVILHKFYVLKHESEQLFSHYFNTHLYFTDFTFICKVIHIFFLHQKLNFMDSMFGSSKQPRSCKKQHFAHVFQYMHKQDVVKLYSIEMYEGQNLDEIIKDKRIKKIPFSNIELWNLIQKLLDALLSLHNNYCYNNRITATSIIINQDNLKLTGIQEPNEKYKDKYIIDGYAFRTDQEYDTIYFPPEKLNSSQYNPKLSDSWQFGVCIVKAALLSTNKELDGIHQSNIVHELISQIKNQYGDEIGNILMLSLKNSIQQRASIKELHSLAFQSYVIPFQRVFLNQTQDSHVTFIRLNSINTKEQLRLTDQLSKSTMLSIKINLYNQDVDNKEFDKLMQLLGDFAIIRDIEIILNKTRNVNISSVLSSLASIKSLINLNLDLKGIQIDQNDIIYGIQILKQMSLMKRLTLDCSSMDFINFLKAELDEKTKMIFYYESQLI
ncbi:unnamed protein product [Paramecium pentaurelia]|uniref:non-specific serine/threonine protein kinase n=1 Tax=Paramecium pentaurelia TaxID=43138 RepID=A0A8S1RXT6_9CILI|nr:unnamed protein product [Paramecium pentaurelia]